MKIVILEDEARAANHLQRLIGMLAPDIEVVDVFETVRDATTFLQGKPDISLLFSDVQLADGLSFEIFSRVQVTCPIIFTTAYDTYAIEAFKANGIDYLLKPIEEERLSQAIEKARKYNIQVDLSTLANLSSAVSEPAYKSRFMVKVGEKIKSIPVGEIKAFYSFDKATFLLTAENRSYIVDYPLDEIQELVNPKQYFRINRKYIVSIEACAQVYAWSNSRLKLEIEGMDDDRIIVARERVQEFKQWLDS